MLLHPLPLNFPMWIALAPEEQGLSWVVADSLHLLPTLFPKKHLGSTRKRISGSGARSVDDSTYLSVGGGYSSAMQGDLRGVPRGERPRRFFGDFLIGEKVTLRSKPNGPLAERVPTRLVDR